MNRYLGLIAAVLLLSACNGTWLKYDTSAPDRLYFKVGGVTNVHSFALIAEDEIEVSYPVQILGTPKNEDRVLPVKVLSELNDGETIQVGSEAVAVWNAREGVDFEVDEVVLPAGKVATSINFRLKRTSSLNGVYRKITVSFEENGKFLRMDADSSNLKQIITPKLTFYMTDGEPACPEWWKTASGGVDYEWGMYYGTYFPAKFRKLLEFYHGIKDINPLLYDELLVKYGENIDKEGLPRNFMSTQDQSIWATYVLIPLHAYYQEYYKEHPENAEGFANTGDLTNRTWGDPMRLLR